VTSGGAEPWSVLHMRAFPRGRKEEGKGGGTFPSLICLCRLFCSLGDLAAVDSARHLLWQFARRTMGVGVEGSRGAPRAPREVVLSLVRLLLVLLVFCVVQPVLSRSSFAFLSLAFFAF